MRHTTGTSGAHTKCSECVLCCWDEDYRRSVSFAFYFIFYHLEFFTENVILSYVLGKKKKKKNRKKRKREKKKKGKEQVKPCETIVKVLFSFFDNRCVFSVICFICCFKYILLKTELDV